MRFALYTEQRRADLVKMNWSCIAGEAIHVKQQKTATDLAINLHPDLCAALAAVQPRRSEAILAGDAEHGLTPNYFGHVMAAAIEAAGLPNECVLHGLPKTAARIVAETGGRVRAMTGHLSARMDQDGMGIRG
jgi:integrase